MKINIPVDQFKLNVFMW